MFNLLTVIGVGFLLGIRHATDPDHVIAVTTIVSRQRSIRHAGLIGILWGLGHTLTILLVGAAIILYNVVIPPRMGLSMELAVGLMLVFLGVMNLTGVTQWVTDRFTPLHDGRGILHSHSHRHGENVHTHVHGHGPEVHFHLEQKPQGRVRDSARAHRAVSDSSPPSRRNRARPRRICRSRLVGSDYDPRSPVGDCLPPGLWVRNDCRNAADYDDHRSALCLHWQAIHQLSSWTGRSFRVDQRSLWSVRHGPNRLRRRAVYGQPPLDAALKERGMADRSRIGAAIDRKLLRPWDGFIRNCRPIPRFCPQKPALSHPLQLGDRPRTERMTAKSKLLEETMAIESGGTR